MMKFQHTFSSSLILKDIILLTCQMPIAAGVFHICVYRSIITPKPDTFHIVYQSIDHERIPHDAPLITVYPSGYFISPVNDFSDRCQLTSILQFHIF